MKKQKFLLLLILCISMISACETEPKQNTAPENNTVSVQENTVTANVENFQKEDYNITFERLYTSEESAKEYAIITVSKNNQTLWNYETEKVALTELDCVELIKSPEDKIYINVAGSIIALDIKTGNELWRNNESSGAGTCSVISENNTLYITGYDGPHLHVIDDKGNTIKRIESFNDDLYHPYEARISDNKLIVKYASDDNAVISIDLDDYSYEINKSKNNG